MADREATSNAVTIRLQNLRDDPVYFSRHVLGFQPYPYQESLLRDSSKRVCAVCGRQIGKSTCAAARLVHFAWTNPNTLSIVVSATLRQSLETLLKIHAFIARSPWLRQCVTRATQTQVFVNNGSRIVGLPSGRYGNTVRGLTAHFIVAEEASFIPDDVIANVLFPMIMTTQGTIWMLTTPWSKDHITYRCFTSPDWSVYHLPSRANPVVTEAFLEEQRQLIGVERFLMEYEGQFVDDAKSYYPMTLIRPCLPDERGPENQYTLTITPEMTLFAGYDPGGKESKAALVVVEKTGDMLNTRLARAEMGKSYTQFTVETADIHNRTPFTRLTIDATGLGEPIVEHARSLSLPAEGLKLTTMPKEQLFANLKLLMEQRKLTLPDDPELLNSLNCVEYERTRTGGYKFSHRPGTFDDLACALALACWGARSQPEPILVGIGS